jgi:hypothetical protein
MGQDFDVNFRCHLAIKAMKTAEWSSCGPELENLPYLALGLTNWKRMLREMIFLDRA